MWLDKRRVPGSYTVKNVECLVYTDGGGLHTCQLSRFRRETPDFEDISRLPDLNKKSSDITI